MLLTGKGFLTDLNQSITFVVRRGVISDMQDKVGELAGYIWRYLEDVGECSVSEAVKQVNGSQTKGYMALGWLARENKVVFDSSGRGTRVRLRQN